MLCCSVNTPCKKPSASGGCNLNKSARISCDLQGKSGNTAASSFPGGPWMLCRIVCWFNAHSGGSVLLPWRRENLKEQAVSLETGICGIQQFPTCLIMSIKALGSPDSQVKLGTRDSESLKWS